MAENGIRPPDAPKPSNSSSSTNRLKNRLILGWSKLPTAQEHTEESIVLGPATLKGYGEDQFDIADSLDQRRSIAGLSSSLWSENTYARKMNSSSIFPSRILTNSVRHNQQATGAESVAASNVGTKRGQSSALSQASLTGDGPSKYKKSSLIKSSTGKLVGAKAKRMGQLSSNVMPHLSVSQYYQTEGDWNGVASSIAIGETEFCYLKPDNNDCYKFSFQNQYPSTQILQNDYSTMSRYGVMRSSAITGQSEMVSHEEMLVEQEIYHKLVQLRVFRQFRLWKTFFVWRKTVKTTKYSDRVSAKLCQYFLIIFNFYLHVLICTALYSKLL